MEDNSVSISNLLEESINSVSPSPSLFRCLNIHSRLVKTGYHSNTDINIKLLILHLKLGSISYARQLFDEMSKPAFSSYIYLLNAYVKDGKITEAFELVHQICTSGLKPNSSLHSSILKAWAELPRSLFLARDFGKQVHAQIIYGADCNVDSSLYETLMDSYVKSGKIDYARRLFDRVLINPSLMCSTSLISGYMSSGRFDEAETIFKVIPEIDNGVFDAMMEGYSKSTDTDTLKKAVEMYFDMLRLGYLPTVSTLRSLIIACTSLASPKICRQVHAHLMTIQDQMDVKIGSAVIDMYSKCGYVSDARRIFDNMPERNEYSWISMIEGYGKHGTPSEVIEMFTKMQEEAHIKPNYVTFLCALTACTRAGLVSKGWDIFESMERKYFMKPQMEHYACMVDLLGRSGRLKQAWDFVMRIPEEPNSDIWAALLSSARLQGDMEMARVAADELVKLGADSGSLRGLSNSVAKEIGIDDTLEKKELTQDVISKDTGCGVDDSLEKNETIQIEDTLEMKEPTQNVISKDTGFSLTGGDDFVQKKETSESVMSEDSGFSWNRVFETMKKKGAVQRNDPVEKKEPTQSVISEENFGWSEIDDAPEEKEAIQIDEILEKKETTQSMMSEDTGFSLKPGGDDCVEKKETTQSVMSEDTGFSWNEVFETMKKIGDVQSNDPLEKKEPTQSVISEDYFGWNGVDDVIEEKLAMMIDEDILEKKETTQSMMSEDTGFSLTGGDDCVEKKETTQSVTSEDWNGIFETMKKIGDVQRNDPLEKKEPTQSVISEDSFGWNGVDDALEENEAMQMEDLAMELQDSDTDSDSDSNSTQCL